MDDFTFRSTSGVPFAFPGALGQRLRMATAAEASFSYEKWRLVATTQNLTVDDEFVSAATNSSAITLTLPAASPSTLGKVYVISKIDVDPNVATINGTAFSTVLRFQYDTAIVVDIGTEHVLFSFHRFGVRTQITRITTVGAGTYNTPAGAVRLRVRMVGGGGGGGSNSTTSNANGGTTGGDTTFGTATAKGGTGGRAANPNTRAALSETSAPDYVLILRDRGACGASGARQPSNAGTTTPTIAGGIGGASLLGAGGQGNAGGSGGAAEPNSGGGGGGGSSNTVNSDWAASGGNSGAGIEFVINNPATSYPYSVGAGGIGNTSGVNSGGDAGSGVIIVEAEFQ